MSKRNIIFLILLLLILIVIFHTCFSSARTKHSVTTGGGLFSGQGIIDATLSPTDNQVQNHYEIDLPFSPINGTLNLQVDFEVDTPHDGEIPEAYLFRNGIRLPVNFSFDLRNPGWTTDDGISPASSIQLGQGISYVRITQPLDLLQLQSPINSIETFDIVFYIPGASTTQCSTFPDINVIDYFTCRNDLDPNIEHIAKHIEIVKVSVATILDADPITVRPLVGVTVNPIIPIKLPFQWDPDGLGFNGEAELELRIYEVIDVKEKLGSEALELKEVAKIRTEKMDQVELTNADELILPEKNYVWNVIDLKGSGNQKPSLFSFSTENTPSKKFNITKKILTANQSDFQVQQLEDDNHFALRTVQPAIDTIPPAKHSTTTGGGSGNLEHSSGSSFTYSYPLNSNNGVLPPTPVLRQGFDSFKIDEALFSITVPTDSLPGISSANIIIKCFYKDQEVNRGNYSGEFITLNSNTPQSTNSVLVEEMNYKDNFDNTHSAWVNYEAAINLTGISSNLELDTFYIVCDVPMDFEHSHKMNPLDASVLRTKQEFFGKSISTIQSHQANNSSCSSFPIGSIGYYKCMKKQNDHYSDHIQIIKLYWPE